MAELLDDFESGLGKWSEWRASNPLVISAGTLTASGTTVRCGSYYNVLTFGAAMEASVILASVGAGALDVLEINLRVSTTSAATASFYNCAFANSAAGGLALNYFNAGAYVSTPASDAAFNSLVAGDILSASCVGSKLQMRRNGVPILTATDANITAGGRIAIEMVSNATAADNLVGGDVWPAPRLPSDLPAIYMRTNR